MDLTHYATLADVFVHPGPGFVADVGRAVSRLGDRHPEAQRKLAAFAEGLPSGDLHALEELYARTFDVQAITTLDVGYVLFGEDYKRGELLANLNREHREAGNDCDTELADHLPNVLRLLPKLADADLRADLVRVLLAPALRRMVAEFEPSRMAEKDLLYRKHHKTVLDAPEDTRTIYGMALEALHDVLREDFGLDAALLDEKASEFVKAVDTEMTIEDCASCPSQAVRGS